MTNINFDSTQIEETFTRLYESGKFTYEQFDEQSKRLFETTNQMKQKEEETKQKEEETKQIASTNIAKNIENLSNAAIKWSDTLAPIFTTALLLFEGGKELYNHIYKKPKENTDDSTK